MCINIDTLWKKFEQASAMLSLKTNPCFNEDLQFITFKKTHENAWRIFCCLVVSVLKIELSSRVVGTSKTLITFVITDHLNFELFNNYVSDNPFRTYQNQPIVHRAHLVIHKQLLQNT